MASSTVTSPFLLKIEQFVRLTREEGEVLLQATASRVRRLSPGEDLIHEGEAPREVAVFLSGWAFRYKQLSNGRRQIIAMLLPGDVCDHNVFLLDEMDHSIAALTTVTVAEVPKGPLEAMALHHPRLAQAMLRETMVNAAVQREWTVNLGQRTAVERIAHLLGELFVRLSAFGRAELDCYAFPLTQMDLAEATGLSAVHVNRTLQELRSRGLILLRSRYLKILDFPALAKVAVFSPAYLHMRRDAKQAGARD